ncbi:MAG: TetR/AcrR family transcriptional regulator [Alphaproteobacteria bacterium]|nr:TetR/AcrR family transcriptional regulator [Alphaproteobacteria bacterium]
MLDRRARAREQTAEEIVDSAERLVLEQDPATVTVASIAKGLGMTAGALYRYFPSREAILARVEARCLGSLADALGRVPSSADPLAELDARCGAFVAWAATEPGRYRLLARMLATPEPLVDGEALEHVVPEALRMIRPLHDALDRAAREGALGPGDAAQRALVVWASLHGALQLAKLGRFVPLLATDGVARQAVAALWTGWGANAERVGALPPWRKS